MDLSGIIFVLLALAWTGYLIPKALKHHDEVARTRSVERFSTAMRVLARREPVSRGDSRLVVTPARPADTPRVLLPSRALRQARSADPSAARRAAAAAARRRRRVLSFLVLADLAVTALAVGGILQGWSVAIPVTLTVCYLRLCRGQVRRARGASLPPSRTVDRQRAEAGSARRPAARVEAPYGTPRNARVQEQETPDEDTVPIPLLPEETVADAASTGEGGSLWDPLPMTLPTYVYKPKAARTVRTINLGEPGAWTSGRIEEDSRLVEETAAVEEETPDEGDGRRAVGS